MTEEALIKLLESEDPTGYRIPMSIGEPHAEVDKCRATDDRLDHLFKKRNWIKIKFSLFL